MVDATTESAASRDRFNSMIAIAVALISAFMAVSKVKDDNIVQGMQRAQSETLDYWNEYQARQQRRVIVEATIQQTRALTPEPVPDQVAKALADWQKLGDTFKIRSEEAAQKAKARQADYDALNERDDLFDLSDAMMSVSLALFAITALVRIRWLFGAATLLGLLGAFFGFAGFAGWTQVHPGWLVALLS
ncbi:DUF4337 domain-containing protein [Prosthecomicrobium sp. N25]|uniref:DUF4337 domain-containing protein n=1 Tax=Prosthecomicrobium sp. N25 TaxID=3129254 RepID=UPI003077CBDF